jgi:hypothetical protein
MPITKDDSKGIEASIREAIERGDFENLKGKGKPLNLNEYFDTPEDFRLGYSILKNAGYIPEEVELLNQITELKNQINTTIDINRRRDLQKKLHDTQLKYDIQMERMKKR